STNDDRTDGEGICDPGAEDMPGAIDHADPPVADGVHIGKPLQKQQGSLYPFIVQLERAAADWDFLRHLHNMGRERADRWLEANFDRLGIESTVDLDTIDTAAVMPFADCSTSLTSP